MLPPEGSLLRVPSSVLLQGAQAMDMGQPVPQLSGRIGGPISVLVARMRASARTPTG